MAQAIDITRHEFPAPGGLVAALREAWRRREVYRRTHAELSALSTRELSDMGISHGMISRLAHEAAYGNAPR